ncbi:M23 family metallopeptidase [Streptomyces sp. NBC_00178]|uniref:murein hydrolase activator EnvC family protein n=1 Tax=Streptomyces sp. NBC_00178 TaxID=2975672 RepID=UPI002E2E0F79|nr:M23 family metallopeptidase [Streptomyces sp. NBC_00178]
MRRTPVMNVVRPPSDRPSGTRPRTAFLAVLLVLSAAGLLAVLPGVSAGWRPASAAAVTPVSASEGSPGAGRDRAWPLAGRPVVVRGWERPAGPYAPGHRGVDLGAPPGTPVRAAAPGRVVFAGPVAGRGVVSVAVAGSGEPPLRFTYEPVRAEVSAGDEVSAGQLVGVVGPAPSHCTGGCLHWGLRRGDVYLDPLTLLPPSLLRRGPSRLLPVLGVPLPDAAPGPEPVRTPGRPRT